MSHGKLREEKDCLNCGHTVEEKYCPNCGQQNIQPKQPFHFLITHFIEDFTHYDGQFWGTLKNLFFKPGKLTNTFLEGKRQQFVPPVKLYIFLSFITFFLFAVFPPFNLDFKSEKGKNEKIIAAQKAAIPAIKKEINDIKIKNGHTNTKEDSIRLEKLQETLNEYLDNESLADDLDMNKGLEDDFDIGGYKTKKSFDSAVAKNPEKWNYANIVIYHKVLELKEEGITKGEILKKFVETSFHNLPKALFIYLPIFAFFLWLFHNKKRWWYFDHGIFTLHYFSYLLITFLTILLLFKLTKLSDISIINWLLYLSMFCLLIYSIIYFYIAHNKVYNTQKRMSFLIGSIILFVNFHVFTFFLVILAVISFVMMH